jgi:hypothetical protein
MRTQQQASPLRLISAIPLLIFLTTSSSGQEPNFAAVKSAVEDGRTAQSRILGFHDAKRLFNELPAAGGVLVGFDCGIGKFFDIETVYAIRALYRTALGEITVADHGLFRDAQLPGRRFPVKSRVVRSVRVRAPAGYAVGGITVRSGLNINGLSVTFMRIKGDALDPRDACLSEWIGDRTGGSERFVDGNGDLVVGICGSQDDDHIKSLGLLYAFAPMAPAKPPPDPPKVEKKADPPPVRRPADPPQKQADPAEPPQKQADPARPEKEKESTTTASGMNWGPLLIFGVVSVPLIVVFLVTTVRKAKPEDRILGGPNAAKRRFTTPPWFPKPASVSGKTPVPPPVQPPRPSGQGLLTELPVQPRPPSEGEKPISFPAVAPGALTAQPAPPRPAAESAIPAAIPVAVPAPPPGTVKKYRAAEGESPPEVLALGPAESVYRPWQFLSVAAEKPWQFVLLGALLLVGGLVLVCITTGPDMAVVRILYCVVMLVGILVGALPFFQIDLSSYVVFRDALVVVRNGIFTVVPWNAIHALNAPRVIVTSDGQQFALGFHLQRVGVLYERIRNELAERMLPPALAILESGGALTFGPLTINKLAIGYQGKTLLWTQVGRVTVPPTVYGVGGGWIGIRSQGSLWPWCQLVLNKVPNSWLLLEVLRRICPMHLLTTAAVD